MSNLNNKSTAEFVRFVSTTMKVDTTPLWINESFQNKPKDKYRAAALHNEKIKTAQKIIIKERANGQKVIQQNSDTDRETAIARINAFRAFQSSRLCIFRATAMHAAIYGTSAEPLIPLLDPEQQSSAEWNENVEATFEYLSLTYALLFVMDLQHAGKTEIQKARRRFRLWDAGVWFTLNAINVFSNHYSPESLSTFFAGTLILGYGFDLVNQYYLDARELELCKINISKVERLLENEDAIIENLLKAENALETEIIPGEAIKIYKSLVERARKIDDSTPTEESNALKQQIILNLEKINQRNQIQKQILTTKIDFNKSYASMLLVGAFILLASPAGIGFIVFATIGNQLNGFLTTKANYCNTINEYLTQLEFLDSIKPDQTITDSQLIENNLRPLNKGEDIEHYIYAQKLSIETKINQTNRQFTLHTSWYAMNISIIIILLACPVANVGFAATLILGSLYVGARKYCNSKNTAENKETELYTSALCRMSENKKTDVSKRNVSTATNQLAVNKQIQTNTMEF